MIDRRRVIILVGETARDVGILLVVFAPLDALFQSDGPDVAVRRFPRRDGIDFHRPRDHDRNMGPEDMRFLIYWAPTLVATVLIIVAGVVLINLERRSIRRRRSGDS